MSLRGELQPSTESTPLGTHLPVSTEQGTPDPAQPIDTSACPVSAVFLSNAAGGKSKLNCQVPSGPYGAARLARCRIAGLASMPPGGVTIGEQFTVVDNPYSIGGKLKPDSMVTDSSGLFDDCCSLFSPDPLPPDFRLKVEQSHLHQGTVISKNMVTYSAGNTVVVRHRHRLPGSCDFSKRCGLV